MNGKQNLTEIKNKVPLYLGIVFLLAYWFFGYDGITFSDEVTYLSMGHSFWNNEPVISAYHFSSRWGTYLFSGFFTQLLGYNDRYASIAPLIFYLLSLLVLWKVCPSGQVGKWTVLFFISHTYLLHFLPKVYPDSFLVLWVILVPAAAVYRKSWPIPAALVMVMALFIGFCTKETMVYLFPFPLLIFFLDLHKKKSLKFHFFFWSISFLLILGYLAYYYLEFGDAFFRFKSINEGHYKSEYCYHDKGWSSIFKRITYSPIFTFMERTYWLWLVMAIPGMHNGVKKMERVNLEFTLCSICLLIGFWFMSSTLEFYNPIYLNPRHLIIIVAPLSINIAFGAKYWLNNSSYKKILSSLLAAGGVYAVLFADWKIGIFYIVFALILWLRSENLKLRLMALSLGFSVLFTVYYQHQLKNYSHFLSTFQKTVENSSPAFPLLTHEFIVHSQEVLLNKVNIQPPVFSLYQMENIKKAAPQRFTLFVYHYYRHAYTAEQEYLERAMVWIKKAGYKLQSSTEDPWLRIEVYEKHH